MSRLIAADTGGVFADGEGPCFIRPAFAGDRLTRLLVHVEIADQQTTAVIDTGGGFLLLDPGLAAEIGLDRSHALARDRVYLRGLSREGSIYRLPVTLLATEGESLTFEATVFVPELGDDEPWPLPSYLGWQGCLDRVRLAVDPADEVVYFGAVDC
jgi:hypothetical protein